MRLRKRGGLGAFRDGVAEEKASGSAPFGLCISGSQKAEVADTDEAAGNNVKEKAANELPGVQLDPPVRTRLAIVASAEGDGTAVEGKDALVGDGGPVSVAAEVVVHVEGTLKGGLGVGVPLDPSQIVDELFACLWVFQVTGVFGQFDFAFPESVCQSIEEFCAKDLCQSPYGHEEVVFRRNPTGAFLVDAASRDDDVQVYVEQEVLIPGVQDGREAGLCL